MGQTKLKCGSGCLFDSSVDGRIIDPCACDSGSDIKRFSSVFNHYLLANKARVAGFEKISNKIECVRIEWREQIPVLASHDVEGVRNFVFNFGNSEPRKCSRCRRSLGEINEVDFDASGSALIVFHIDAQPTLRHTETITIAGVHITIDWIGSRRRNRVSISE